MDIILYNILVGFCCLFFGYLFGSIPCGVIIGKVFYHKDPRLEGSKNSGGTNVGRIMGKKAGLAVIFLDMLKCAIPVIVVWAIFKFSPLLATFEQNLGQAMWDNGVFYIYLTPIGVAIGHCWPVFANFRGGKAVANFGGYGLATSWFCSLIGFATFFVTLKLKKYVSLGSIMAAVTSIIAAWIMFGLQFWVPESFWHIGMWGWGDYLLAGWEYAASITFVGGMLIVRHKANIGRLIRHEERKVTWL